MLRKKIFAHTMLLLVSFFCFSQEKIHIENSGLSLNIFTLKNGLTLFVVPDKNSALVNTELVCRSGFSSQTPSTCGFFSMYSRLFSRSAEEECRKVFDLLNLKSECKSQSTTYSATLPPEELENYLNSLSVCLTRPSFDDRDISSVLEEMKKESSEYASSTAGFINSAIDSVVFSDSPWKHDSGIYPSLFCDYSTAQARTILSNIWKNYYTPDNCALFVSGNVQMTEVLEISEKAFAMWNRGEKTKINLPDMANSNQPKENKKYVIVSSDFSKEITQIVVQFFSLNSSQADILAAAMNAHDSKYKNLLPAEPQVCIRGSDYLTAASAQINDCNRVILQALMEETDEAGIAEQAELFLSKAKESSVLERNDFVGAQNEILFKFRLQTGNCRTICQLLADYWAQAAWTTPKEFYNGFQERVYRIQYENEESISAKVLEEEPFVFLLVNSDKYKQNKKHFDARGYVLIDQKNNSWWKNEILARQAENEKKVILDKRDEKNYRIIKARPAEYFYANSSATLSHRKLSNGIPLSVKENKGTQTVCVSIAIDGGMISSPVKEKNLRTILVSAIAKNSGIIGIKPETRETVSYITYEVAKEELENSLKHIADALIYGDITPVQADRLFAEENYRILMENADLGSQLKRNVYAYLFRNSKPGNMYRDYDNKNNSASYQSLLSGYTEFLNASLYSIVICGDTNMEQSLDAAEKTFGLLKNLDKKEEFTFPKPAWGNKERKVQLRHLFSSDLPPELAPKESPLLIPTKEFLDPVQLYFSAPENTGMIEKFNALLMELSSRIDRETESYCKSYSATKSIPIGYIHGNKIKKSEAFRNLYKKHRKNLLEELKDNDKSERTLRTIKTRYEISILEKTSTNEGTAGLIQNSIQEGTYSTYLENYLELENASAQDFCYILENYIKETPSMTVRSVDGK